MVSEIKPCLHPVEPTTYPWGPWEECPPGEHVKGMQLIIQPKRGGDFDNYQRFRDDTALNTIILTCTDGTKLTSTRGLSNDQVSCSQGDCLHSDGFLRDYVEIDDPDNNGIKGVWMRGQHDCGCCDDTAANGVRFLDLNDKTYKPGN